MTPLTIEEEFHCHRQVLETTVRQSASLINDVATAIVTCFKKGNKLLLCGNGGSAADAQHVAAEFVNRFRLVRGAMPALALTTDTSIITSVANDSAFEDVFARQVEALAVGGDILVGISTSGGAANVLRALDAARARGVTTVGFTGDKGRRTLATKCDYCLVVPSADTARIQECHGFAWHVICGIVERAMFPQG
jgi:D-sedoheptulose 7-phosphate isomerase